MRHPAVDERKNSPTRGQGIDGKLQLAIEDPATGEPTGEIVEYRIVQGVMEVDEAHVDHVIAGVHGSSIIPDGDADG